MSNEVTIYTDGSSWPNPGPGGWAAIIGDKEISGSEKSTTNNRMEITGVVRGLQYVTEPSRIKIYSDSQYVVNSIGCWEKGRPTKLGWIVGWKRRGWTRREGELKNIDLWQEIDRLVRVHESVELIWVRGHNNDALNEKCDKLALAARTANE